MIEVSKPFFTDEKYWYVTRHADCVKILDDRVSSKDFIKWLELDKVPTGWLESNRYKELQEGTNAKSFNHYDDPEHSQLREPFTLLFSQTNIQRLSTLIREDVRRIVSNNLNNKNFDILRDLCDKVAGNNLLNLIDITEITQNGEEFLKHGSIVFYGAFRADWAFPFTEQEIKEIEESKEFFKQTLAPIIIDRLQEPKNDIISKWLHEYKMNPFTVALNIATLLGAGKETNNNAIAEIFTLLAEQKELQLELRSRKSIKPTNFEELLRVSTKKLLLTVILKEDVVIDDLVLEKGQFVVCDVVAAGFDPEVFTEPFQIDLDRKLGSNLFFGHGLHSCIGRILARTLGCIMLEEVLNYTSNFNLLDGIEYKDSWVMLYPTKVPFLLEK